MDQREIIEVFKKYDTPIVKDDVWTVQKATVVKHKALERLAANMKIMWREPKVLRAEGDECVIMVFGTTKDLPEGVVEWSIGEAKIVPMVDTGRKNNYGKPIYEAADGSYGNYQITPKQASYPYAMAEKRAKDRVILKLAGLHGAYSEDEADDFSDERQKRYANDSAPSAPAKVEEAPPTAPDMPEQAPEMPAEPQMSEPEGRLEPPARAPDTRTPEQKAEDMKKKVLALDTIAKVTNFMTNKAVIKAFEEMGPDLTESVKKVGRERQAELKAARDLEEAQKAERKLAEQAPAGSA